MAYETWWSVHLYTYLALFLAFSHQVDTGASFVGHPGRRRTGRRCGSGRSPGRRLPRRAAALALAAPSGARSSACTPRAQDTYASLLEGRRLDRLPIAGGQFLQWRFLRRGLWWQAHPYSLSAAPTGRHLRITVKDLGDHIARAGRAGARDARGDRGALRRLHRRRAPGRPAAAGRRRRRHHADPRAAAGAARAGVDVDVVLRASQPRRRSCSPTRSPTTSRRRGGRVHELVGPRARGPAGRRRAARAWCPTSPSATSTSAGREASRTRRRGRRRARPASPADRIHLESFSLYRKEPSTFASRTPSSSPRTVAGMAAVLSFKPHEPALPATAATPPETGDARPSRQRHRARTPRPSPAARSPRAMATRRSRSRSRAAGSPRSRRCSCRATSPSRSRSPARPSRSSSRRRCRSRPPRSTPSPAPRSPRALRGVAAVRARQGGLQGRRRPPRHLDDPERRGARRPRAARRRRRRRPARLRAAAGLRLGRRASAAEDVLDAGGQRQREVERGEAEGLGTGPAAPAMTNS